MAQVFNSRDRMHHNRHSTTIRPTAGRDSSRGLHTTNDSSQESRTWDTTPPSEISTSHIDEALHTEELSCIREEAVHPLESAAVARCMAFCYHHDRPILLKKNICIADYAIVIYAACSVFSI
jgi:hypothetical protein